jgi:hypothetical protein
VSDGQGTILTVDDALIPANVLGFDERVRGPATLSVPVTPSDLVDHDGTKPARAPSTFGNGLFGAFTGTMEIAYGRWILLTVGAGNSVSDAGGTPLRLANLVVIDKQTARVVQTVNLAWELRMPVQQSTGAQAASVPQSLPAAVLFVPDLTPNPGGTVYVAMSNGAGTSQSLGVFYPGTVQSWRADFTKPQPLSPDTTGKAALDVTRTYVSAYFNPVGLARHHNSIGSPVLILTSAGASFLDSNFVAQPTTDAVLEFLDLATQQWRPTWEANLGALNANATTTSNSRASSSTALSNLRPLRMPAL